MIDNSEQPALLERIDWPTNSGASRAVSSYWRSVFRFGVPILLAVIGGAYYSYSGRGDFNDANPSAPSEGMSVHEELRISTIGESERVLDATGYVKARRRATVATRITGRVKEILVEEGQRVVRGQVVARLEDSREAALLGEARARLRLRASELEAIKEEANSAALNYQRQRKLFDARLISANDFGEATIKQRALDSRVLISGDELNLARMIVETAQEQLQDTIIVAPFDGIVVDIAAQTGEIVSPSSAGDGFTRTGIGTIVDMTSLEVEVDVNETFVSRIHPSQRVDIRLNAFPDWQVPGEVIAVIPTANRSNATVRVRVAFLEGQRDARIVPDLGARVSFLGQSAK